MAVIARAIGAIVPSFFFALLAVSGANGPTTYMLNGRQYLLVAVSGAVVPGEIMAFRLPGK